MNKYYNRHFGKIDPLIIQRYERYLPTAFDESLSLLEKMNKMIYAFNDIIKDINDFGQGVDQNLQDMQEKIEFYIAQFDEFKDQIENELLPESTENILNAWFENGKLADLINFEVFNMKVNKSDVPVNIQDFKAFKYGDDWKPAIDVALTSSRQVYFPEGVYQTSTVSLESDVTIIGDGDNTSFYPMDDTLFEIIGEVGNEKTIVSDVDDFSTDIYLADKTTLNPGDHVLIKSQRDALDETDAGKNYTMGTRTGSFTCYLGEFNRIHQVFDDYVELDDNTEFPVYYHHNNNETSEYSRPSSTLQKVNFKSNITLKNFSISKVVRNTINVVYGYNVLIENVSCFDNSYDGTTGRVVFINFEESKKCKALNCHFEFERKVHPDLFYQTNVYMIGSSTNCGFDGCYAEYGGQTFDITFKRNAIIGVRNFVRNCEIINSNSTAVSLHGGLYQSDVKNNTIVGTGQGVSVRGRNALVTGNTIKGNDPQSTSENNSGIRVYDKWAVDCIISNNIISNFRSGVNITDSLSNFEYVGLIATNNTIKNCMSGVRIWTNWSNDNLADRSIVISNNTIMLSDIGVERVYGFYSRRYNRGVSLIGNTITYNGDGDSTGVYFSNDCKDAVVKDNIVTNCKTGISLPEFNTSAMYENTESLYLSVMGNRVTGETEPQDKLSDRVRYNLENIYSALPLHHVDRHFVDIPNNTLYLGSNGTLRYKDSNGENRIISTDL